MQAVVTGRVPEPRTTGSATILVPCPRADYTPVEKQVSNDQMQDLEIRRLTGALHGVANITYVDHSDTFNVLIADNAFPEMHIHFTITDELFDAMKAAKRQ